MSASSRKRAAPNTNTAQNTVAYVAPSPVPNIGLPNEQFAPDWTQAGTYTDQVNGLPNLNYDPLNFGFNGLPADEQVTDFSDPQLAGQLVRRNVNNQLSRQDDLPWEIEEQSVHEDGKEDEEEDEATLERRAQEAKKEALAKKRQIPPFVQKISSFLEQSRNTDLIRWSDDGRSFIVLDEDEFAKTLIPELFKHNNYASFVRQLNMYGFHKKVGLADNSMKASENKRKTPSEYANPYFRRGQPDLLWLIQKPKATTGNKADAKAEDEEDESSSKKRISAPNQLQRKRGGSTNSSKDLVAVTQNDLDTMRQEIIGLKQQNRVISEVITNMKKQNMAIHQQAIQFQQAQERFQLMHERHENSINAILTFLATFYNRSLEGQGGQSIANMIAQTLGQGNQSGNIVDMTDLPDMNLDMQNIPNRSNTPRQRRAQLLLPAPPVNNKVSPPQSMSRFQNVDTPPSQNVDAQNVAVTPSDGPDIMSLINAANTNSPQGASTNALDFDSALDHIQNADGNIPLTEAQRSDVLQRMTDDANLSLNTGARSNAQPIPSTALTPTANSPINLPSPNLEKILHHQDSLDYVQKLQEQQAKRVQTLAERLGPLSPNGAVPGLHDGNSPLPENWNLDDWLNNNEYFQTDNTFDPTGSAALDLDDDLFAANHAPDQQTNGFEIDPSPPQADASPATVEEVEDADLSINGGSNPRKRRRRD